MRPAAVSFGSGYSGERTEGLSGQTWPFILGSGGSCAGVIESTPEMPHKSLDDMASEIFQGRIDWRHTSLAIALLWLFGCPAATQAAAPELRATWLTTTASDDLARSNIATSMSSLRKVGLNTVYVEAWKNGYTNFHSPTLSAFLNRSSLNPSLGGRVLLEESRSAAAAAGLVHGGWFEYGLMAQFVGSGGSPSNPLATKARDNGWLLRDSAGNYANASNAFAWMNPLVPEVRALVKGIVIDAIDQFDLQVVQFDDHLSWPVQFGYDAYTANAYKTQTGRDLPANFSNSRFVAWRQGVMQDFVTEVVSAVRVAHPDVIVSLSPSVASFSAANYCTSWPDYIAAGLFDEVVPQVYRSTYASFASEWTNQINAVGGTDLMAAGVRLLGSGAATPWADLEQMLDRSRDTNAFGHSIWFSEGVSNAGTSNAANYNAELTAYYDVAGNGPAANPHFTTLRWSGADGTGGNGTWNTLATSWKNGASAWVRDATGVFEGAGGAVTIDGTVLAGGGLRFSTDGYELTGGTLELCGWNQQANTIEVAASATARMSAALTGTAGMIKDGAGRLELVAATSVRGTTTVRDGQLVVAHSESLSFSPIVVENGLLEFRTGGSPPALDIRGGRVTLASTSRSVLSLETLSLDARPGSGLLDLGKGRIDIAAGGISPTDLRAAIIAGRNGGGWDGGSGITSGIAANDAAFAVGYTVDSTGAASVAWAALGDSNLDGLVNFDDILALFPNYDQPGSFGWQEGDFTYDSLVNFDDILALFPNYNRPGYLGGGFGGGGGFAASGLGGSLNDLLMLFEDGSTTNGFYPVAVPEPSTSASSVLALGLLCVGAALRLRWRTTRLPVKPNEASSSEEADTTVRGGPSRSHQ